MSSDALSRLISCPWKNLRLRLSVRIHQASELLPPWRRGPRPAQVSRTSRSVSPLCWSLKKKNLILSVELHLLIQFSAGFQSLRVRLRQSRFIIILLLFSYCSKRMKQSNNCNSSSEMNTSLNEEMPPESLSLSLQNLLSLSPAHYRRRHPVH